MAPTILNPFNHIMSNPNTNAFLSLLQNARSTATASAAGFKTVRISPDRLSVRIMEIAPLDKHIWKEAHIFIV